MSGPVVVVPADHSMPTEIRQLLRRGTVAFEAGDYGEAETLLLRVAAQRTDYANVFNMLGVMASLRGAPERAAEMFRRALTLNPHYTEAQLNLAITLTDMGAYESAEVETRTLQLRASGEPDRSSPVMLSKLANAHADLARTYHALEMYAEAITEYDKAIGLCPGFADIHNRRAVSCRELGDYAGAHTSLARALELNPRYVEAYVNLGQLYQQMGRLEEAITAWEHALDLLPTHPLAPIYLAQARANRAAAG
jgi:tetratricopeptide (TPR) repeat protein